MEPTDTFYGIAIPTELVLPTKPSGQTGKKGTLFISGSKLFVVVADGGAPQLVTSA